MSELETGDRVITPSGHHGVITEFDRGWAVIIDREGNRRTSPTEELKQENK